MGGRRALLIYRVFECYSVSPIAFNTSWGLISQAYLVLEMDNYSTLSSHATLYRTRHFPFSYTHLPAHYAFRIIFNVLG